MDKLARYRRAVMDALTKYGSYTPLHPEIEKQLIFDTERDHYQLVHNGWRGHERTYGCSVHIDIKDGQVWIQEDVTDFDVAGELLARGVAREDIVLGFLSPRMRQHSEFAAA
jgi:hypothetical protein